jgi:hypothetical protein
MQWNINIPHYVFQILKSLLYKNYAQLKKTLNMEYRKKTHLNYWWTITI